MNTKRKKQQIKMMTVVIILLLIGTTVEANALTIKNTNKPSNSIKLNEDKKPDLIMEDVTEFEYDGIWMLSLQIKNIGTAPVIAWTETSIRLEVRALFRPSEIKYVQEGCFIPDKEIKPGETVCVDFDSPYNVGLCIFRIDPNDTIDELNENNNEFRFIYPLTKTKSKALLIKPLTNILNIRNNFLDKLITKLITANAESTYQSIKKDDTVIKSNTDEKPDLIIDHIQTTEFEWYNIWVLHCRNVGTGTFTHDDDGLTNLNIKITVRSCITKRKICDWVSRQWTSEEFPPGSWFFIDVVDPTQGSGPFVALPLGRYILTFEIDPENKADELNESNNTIHYLFDFTIFGGYPVSKIDTTHVNTFNKPAFIKDAKTSLFRLW